MSSDKSTLKVNVSVAVFTSAVPVEGRAIYAGKKLFTTKNLDGFIAGNLAVWLRLVALCKLAYICLKFYLVQIFLAITPVQQDFLIIGGQMELTRSVLLCFPLLNFLLLSDDVIEVLIITDSLAVIFEVWVRVVKLQVHLKLILVKPGFIAVDDGLKDMTHYHHLHIVLVTPMGKMIYSFFNRILTDCHI